MSVTGRREERILEIIETARSKRRSSATSG